MTHCVLPSEGLTERLQDIESSIAPATGTNELNSLIRHAVSSASISIRALRAIEQKEKRNNPQLCAIIAIAAELLTSVEQVRDACSDTLHIAAASLNETVERNDALIFSLRRPKPSSIKQQLPLGQGMTITQEWIDAAHPHSYVLRPLTPRLQAVLQACRGSSIIPTDIIKRYVQERWDFNCELHWLIMSSRVSIDMRHVKHSNKTRGPMGKVYGYFIMHDMTTRSRLRKK